MTDQIITVLSAGGLSTTAPTGPYSCCPTCGDPYIGGPGCYASNCAMTCGDPKHEPGDCTDRCWNPHLYDGKVTA
jgi:hypothetical protein